MAGPRPDPRPSLVRSIAHRLGGGRAALPVEGHLPPFDGATGWLNSAPLTPERLRGRVVLVDFWTYTCVNWLRTLPYLRAWAAKYADAGLTVVGVHSPEFAFERDAANVAERAQDLGVTYAVALDADHAVWRAFANHFWPALYLADGEGRIRYHHFGEGEYAASEMAVQQLLLEAGAAGVEEDLVSVEARGLEVGAQWSTLRSPETYLGYGQSTGFASEGDATADAAHDFVGHASLPLNHWDLAGRWTVGRHAARLRHPGGRVAFQFHARDVNLIMGPTSRGGSVRFRVLLDGEAPRGASGTDLGTDGHGTAPDQRCYQLVRQDGPIVERRVEIEFLDAGVDVYCFTFG